jgi:peptidoglycan/xylan/chitin deacetylase (PgdA/CDA1 family)
MYRYPLGGKRELLARGLFWSGATLLLNQLRQRNQLLVLCYHRIGDPQGDLFDPGLFSATPDQLDAQLTYLKRHVSLVTLEEALRFIEGGGERTSRCRVLITFDDGYLDNYQLAFPILRAHGVQGVFFLATDMVGSSCIPWWDRIAYLMKTARKRRFTLHYPVEREFDLGQGSFTGHLGRVLTPCYTLNPADIPRVVEELAAQAGGEQPPDTERRFLNWDEARAMIRGGMAIGSHTRSHLVLSRLSADEQKREMSSCRERLQESLGIESETLAYPYGRTGTVSELTRQLARDTGYRAAFSLERGVNLPGKTHPFDVKRICVDAGNLTRFQVQATMCSITGEYWP